MSKKPQETVQTLHCKVKHKPDIKHLEESKPISINHLRDLIKEHELNQSIRDFFKKGE